MEIKGMYSIYKHSNKINGKIYVGMTKLKPEIRWSGGSGYCLNKDFNEDINRFGWESFTHEVLSEGLTHDQAIRMEIKLIEELGANSLDKGYNRTRGGETSITTGRPKKRNKKLLDVVYFEPELLAWLKEKADKQKCTVSVIVNVLVEKEKGTGEL